MVVSVEENNLIEQIAKFEGLKELLEDDLNEEEFSLPTYSNISANHPAFKQLYLDLLVAYKKYKNRFVPSSVTEDDFVSSGHDLEDEILPNKLEFYQRHS